MRALTIAAALLTVSTLTACADEIPSHVPLPEPEPIQEVEAVLQPTTQEPPSDHESESEPDPQQAQPLPLADIYVSSGEVQTVQLLGLLPDDGLMVKRVAVRGNPGDEVRWIDEYLLPEGIGNSELPTYDGPVAGEWTEAQYSKKRVMVPVFRPLRPHIRPQAPALPYLLIFGWYGVLGRSLDAQWLAIHYEHLYPPVIWIPFEDLPPLPPPRDIPIFLNNGLEIFALNERGEATSSIILDQPTDWEWAGGSDLLVYRVYHGTSILNAGTGEERRVSLHHMRYPSPDGRYAVAWYWSASTRDGIEDWRAGPLLDVEIVRLDDGQSFEFTAVHRRLPTFSEGGLRSPYVNVEWSADSTWLLSPIFGPDGGIGEQIKRLFALSVHGEQVEIILPEETPFVWWETLYKLEQQGELSYLNADGDPIDRPWSMEMLAASVANYGDFGERRDPWRINYWAAPGSVPPADDFVVGLRWRDARQSASDRYASHLDGRSFELAILSPDGEVRQLFRSFGSYCHEERNRGLLSRDSRWFAVDTGEVRC